MNRLKETVEARTIRKSRLDETHVRLGATMQERDGWSVPASYGDVLFEYAAVRESGVGLIDLSPRGCIQVSGTEAVQFLNGLITNDMKTLEENHWMPAAFPNVQGRLIASVRVIRQPDDTKGKKPCPIFLLDTEPATHDAVLKTIERFTFAGDFQVSDITAQTAVLSLQGAGGSDAARGALGGDLVAQIGPGGAAVASYGGEGNRLTVIRATHTAEDGFDLFVSADHANRLWEVLSSAGARPFGYDALDILRIEAGVPRYGVDMDESNVVIEAGLDDAVSYTKGCYVGQEIIARIKYRGHVAKKLTGLMFDQATKVAPAEKIKCLNDKEIGRLTSVTYSPHLGRTIALGYVKYDYLAPGTSVRIVSGENEFPAEVTALPFVWGSWYASAFSEPQTAPSGATSL